MKNQNELANMAGVTANGEGNIQTIVPEQKKVLRDLSAVFFDPVRLGPDDPFRSPLCAPADILRQQGMQGKLLQSSLLTVLTMVSARLGQPLALMLIDKDSTAQAIVSMATPFVPKGSIFECMELPSDNLYMAANDLPGKVIVNPDFSGLKKVKTDLEHLVEHGHVQRQEKVSSKFRKGIEALEIKGPVSVVTVSDDPANADWKGSAIVKLSFSPDDGAGLSTIRTINDDAFHVDTCELQSRSNGCGHAKCRFLLWAIFWPR